MRLVEGFIYLCFSLYQITFCQMKKGAAWMGFVYPIKDSSQIEALEQELRRRGERDYILFLFGIYSGLRISDILALRVEDVGTQNRIQLKEAKTGKEKSFPIAKPLRKALNQYLQGHSEKYLFPSPKKKGYPITRQQAYWIFNEAAKQVGIQESIGTHTLRKTFAYWAYKQGTSLELIQKILNHSSPSVTLRYIGITQEQIDEVYEKLSFR